MTLIEVTVSTVIVGVLATVSYATISSKMKGNAQVTEAKMIISKFAIDNQESVLTGNIIAAPPASTNYTYTTAKFPAGVIVTASHRKDNNQVFALIKNAGAVDFCRTIQQCR